MLVAKQAAAISAFNILKTKYQMYNLMSFSDQFEKMQLILQHLLHLEVRNTAHMTSDHKTTKTITWLV